MLVCGCVFSGTSHICSSLTCWTVHRRGQLSPSWAVLHHRYPALHMDWTWQTPLVPSITNKYFYYCSTFHDTSASFVFAFISNILFVFYDTLSDCAFTHVTYCRCALRNVPPSRGNGTVSIRVNWPTALTPTVVTTWSVRTALIYRQPARLVRTSFCALAKHQLIDILSCQPGFLTRFVCDVTA